MKRLVILRHAKAKADGGAAGDFGRPLSRRGYEQARLVGEELTRIGASFDHVAASPATRVRETLAGAGIGGVSFDEALYSASADALLRAVRAFPDGAKRVLIAGHNPGLQELILELARPGPLTERAAARFPTAAAAIVQLPGSSWTQADRGTCELLALILPDELAG